jgi:hypothetical protein
MLCAKTKEPIHLDGAVRLYDEERMLARLEQNVYQAGRHSDYTKLWRIDGAISVAGWKSVITQYFRDNWLVGEYFGAPPTDFQPEVVAEQDSPVQVVIPYNMETADGVQLHVSYHHKDDSTASERTVVLTDALTDGDGTELYFMDSTATELIKRLRREGESIDVPPEITRVAFGDTVLNLPQIRHCGQQAVTAAERTLTILSGFLRDFAASYDDRLISFSIAIEYDDREVLLSGAGHIQALVRWFDDHPVTLPRTAETFPQWLDTAYSTLNRLFPEPTNHRSLHRLLQATGMLVFIRQFVDPDLFEITRNEASGDLEIQTLVDGSNTDLVQVLESGQVQPAPMFRVDYAECTLCGENYEHCPHVKFEEDRVGQRLVDAPVIGAFWTNRRA